MKSSALLVRISFLPLVFCLMRNGACVCVFLCLCVCERERECVCDSGRGGLVRGGVGRCLRWEVRGDWWFTEEHWWVIHLRQPRQSPWQHEWPVICHPAQRPPLRSSVGWDIYTPSALLPEASPYISLNCKVILRAECACLSVCSARKNCLFAFP